MLLIEWTVSAKPDLLQMLDYILLKNAVANSLQGIGVASLSILNALLHCGQIISCMFVHSTLTGHCPDGSQYPCWASLSCAQAARALKWHESVAIRLRFATQAMLRQASLFILIPMRIDQHY